MYAEEAKQDAEQYGRLRFAAWKSAVDRAVEELCGLGADDLPDKPYWDWMESGMTPQEAAEKALAEEGW